MTKRRWKSCKNPEVYIQCDGTDMFVILDDVKIAKRGYPGTAHAKTWVSLEPGWSVLDNASMTSICLEYRGEQVAH